VCSLDLGLRHVVQHLKLHSLQIQLMQFILVFMYVRKTQTHPIAAVVPQDWSTSPRESHVFRPQWANTAVIPPIPLPCHCQPDHGDRLIHVGLMLLMLCIDRWSLSSARYYCTDITRVLFVT